MTNLKVHVAANLKHYLFREHASPRWSRNNRPVSREFLFSKQCYVKTFHSNGVFYTYSVLILPLLSQEAWEQFSRCEMGICVFTFSNLFRFLYLISQQSKGISPNSTLILIECKRINQFLSPLKSSESLWFFYDFRVSRFNI